MTREYLEHQGSMASSVLVVALGVVLVAILAATVYFGTRQPVRPVSAAPPETSQLLGSSERPSRQFDPSAIPPWLYGHVGAIAALQVLAVLAAARRASRTRLRRTDVRSIQFLVEIPMYLGLFGTLVGVCLTQFVSGSLVAPLAYLTTMAGIVLHIVGKLFVLLPLPEHGLPETE